MIPIVIAGERKHIPLRFSAEREWSWVFSRRFFYYSSRLNDTCPAQPEHSIHGDKWRGGKPTLPCLPMNPHRPYSNGENLNIFYHTFECAFPPFWGKAKIIIIPEWLDIIENANAVSFIVGGGGIIKVSIFVKKNVLTSGTKRGQAY